MKGPEDFYYVSAIYRCPGDTIVVDEFKRLGNLDPGLRFVRKVLLFPNLVPLAQPVVGLSADCTAVLLEGDGRVVPAHKPAYARLLVDDEANLWVQSYPATSAGRGPVWAAEPGGEPEIWWIFTREGRLSGEVQMPAGLTPLRIRRNLVIGVWRDDDVEYVRIHRVRT